jgi:hypothetical protein
VPVQPAEPLSPADDLEASPLGQATLAAFSGKMPVWIVQIPAASFEAISRSSSTRPTPRLDMRSAT